MSNMSYAQFENTYNDLRQCYDAMDDDDEGTEAIYKAKLIKLCKKIVEEYGEQEEDD